MDLNLAGKRALVTGSSLGIGRAIAEALLAEGASVIVNSRDKGRVDQAVAELSPRGEVCGCVVVARRGRSEGGRSLESARNLTDTPP